MTKLRIVGITGIIMALTALLYYIGYNSIEYGAPVLCTKNYMAAFISVFLSSSGYWFILLSENKSIMAASKTDKTKTIRGFINTPEFAYSFLAGLGVIGIYSASVIIFMELYVYAK